MSTGYSKMPNWFYDEAVPALGLKAAQVAAYGVIVRHADSDGVCWPSLDLIAHEGGMSRGTAGAVVKTLAAHGLIKMEPGKRSITGRPPNRYQVCKKPVLPEVPERKRRSVPGHATESLDYEPDKGQGDEPGTMDQKAGDYGSKPDGTLARQLVQKKTHRTRPIEGSAHAGSDARASATQDDGPSSSSEPEKNARKKKWTYLPGDFAPSGEHHDIARERGVSLGEEFKRFRDYHLANGSRKVDWDAELRLWLGRSRPEGNRSRSTRRGAAALMKEVLDIKLPGEDGFDRESVA